MLYALKTVQLHKNDKKKSPHPNQHIYQDTRFFCFWLYFHMAADDRNAAAPDALGKVV